MGREINCCQNQQNYLHSCRNSINYFVGGGPSNDVAIKSQTNNEREVCNCLYTQEPNNRVDTDAILDDTSEERPRARENLY